MNSITIDGRLGRDPETFGQGKVTSASMCNNTRSRNAKTGQWDSKTTWVKITGFNLNAQRLATLRKGDHIIVDGTLREEQWEGRDGKKHSTLTITINQFWKLEDIKTEKPQEVANPDQVPQEEYPWASEPASGDDSDVPF